MHGNDELGNEIFGNGDGSRPALGGLTPLVMVSNSGLFGTPVTADGQVEFHDGPKIVLPRGTTYEQAIKTLQRHKEDAETPTTWDRQFTYRPNDGGHATMKVLGRLFGTAFGDAKEVNGFLGKEVIPSQSRTIEVGLDKRIQIPWGLVTTPQLPDLEIILCDQHPHRDYGQVFELHMRGPRKYKDEVEKIFEAVEEELKTNSIYRGQALTGSDELEFFDVNTIDPNKIVFSDPVQRTLEAKLWSVLRYPEILRQEGVSLKRTVLLYGPFGTGKTSAGILTAQVALSNGWTVLFAKTGDDIEDVLQTARLYQKAMVFFEDVDREGNKHDEDGLASLLDTFDGATAKGGELVVVLTTNREDEVPRGMLRPGRLDACIKVAELDRNGTERLIKALIPADKLAKDVDYDEVFKAMEGYLPAFVRESVDSAKLFAVTRLDGAANYVITTQDLTNAAESLREQFIAHQGAPEGIRNQGMDHAMLGLIQRAFAEGRVVLPGFGEGTIALNGNSAKATQ